MSWALAYEDADRLTSRARRWFMDDGRRRVLENAVETWTYDDNNGVVDYKAPDGILLMMRIDPMWGVVYTKQADGTEAFMDVVDVGQRLQMRYRSPTGAGEESQTAMLDGLGRTTSILDDERMLASFAYDGRGRRIASEKFGVRRTYTFDAFGQLLEEHAGASEPTRKLIRHFEYYNDGLLQRQIGGAGAFADFVHDGVGRVRETRLAGLPPRLITCAAGTNRMRHCEQATALC